MFKQSSLGKLEVVMKKKKINRQEETIERKKLIKRIEQKREINKLIKLGYDQEDVEGILGTKIPDNLLFFFTKK